MVFELIFENVADEELVLILREVLGADAVVRRWALSGINEENVGLEEAVGLLLGVDADAAHLANATLTLSNSLRLATSMRILRYDQNNDIEIAFMNLDWFEDAESLLSMIHPWSSAVAEKYNIKSWFFGIEPASDEDTRLFTGRRLGPLPSRVLAG